MRDEVYVIWSFEHEAWWRPGGFGYTPQLSEAGRFRGWEAAAIVAGANAHRPEEYERLLRLEDAERFGPPRSSQRPGRHE